MLLISETKKPSTKSVLQNDIDNAFPNKITSAILVKAKIKINISLYEHLFFSSYFRGFFNTILVTWKKVWFLLNTKSRGFYFCLQYIIKLFNREYEGVKKVVCLGQALKWKHDLRSILGKSLCGICTTTFPGSISEIRRAKNALRTPLRKPPPTLNPEVPIFFMTFLHISPMFLRYHTWKKYTSIRLYT